MANRRPGPFRNGGRLPPIAPRINIQPPTTPEQSSQDLAPGLTKSRLPPRSRNGCWTCRNRKVKCDEGRPSCNQCTRLGHTCDYSPKLSFKDETRKTVHKFLGPGSSDRQWDTSAELSAAHSLQSPRNMDSLTPVTSSSTEEDLQKEAERQLPGTYLIVVNPDSFRDTEEYQRSPKNDTVTAGISSNTTSGPTTLIVGSFFSFVSESQNSPLNYAPAESPSPVLQAFGPGAHPENLGPVSEHLHVSPPSEQDATEHLTSHYRNFIRRYISCACGGSRFGMNIADSQDLFEKEAENFPPLRHAILALSALSLFYREKTPEIDALQHYEQALRPLQRLRSEEELASDGAFLTHFILLLYEIAGAERDHFWTWTSHMSSLARIVHIRRRLLEIEPYPCIVWWIFLIDLNALLSGSGSAEFIDVLTGSDMVPTETEMRGSQSIAGSGALFGQVEPELLSAAWQFQREVSSIAAEIGRLALQIREILSRQQDLPTAGTLLHWQQQSLRYRDMLKRCWRTRMRPNLASYMNDQTISDSVEAVMDFTRLIYEVCLIYTHRMMWPTQQFDLGSEDNTEVPQAVTTILDIATVQIEKEVFDIRGLVLPVLLAGIFADSASQKMRAQELLRSLEHESIGSNTKYTRRLLDKVYERQNQKLMISRNIEVDCILIMRETGEQTVHLGL